MRSQLVDPKLVAGSGIGVAAIILVWMALPYLQTQQQSPHGGMSSKFVELSEHGNSACFGQQTVLSKPDAEHLTGSCCGKMSQHRYEEQVDALQKYADIPEIPTDPYDISLPLAKKLIGYKNSIQLSAAQQGEYDGAMNMSHEGGPCCCKCWRWDAYEGLAKFLITQHGFTGEQVAEVWDLSDGCGGDEHAQGVAHAN